MWTGHGCDRFSKGASIYCSQVVALGEPPGRSPVSSKPLIQHMLDQGFWKGVFWKGKGLIQFRNEPYMQKFIKAEAQADRGRDPEKHIIICVTKGRSLPACGPFSISLPQLVGQPLSCNIEITVLDDNNG